ncbi:MAG TPA: tetratricopeptide repeat protein [Burkholderiales bacterium]|nr:tetratricopeptide repeat protein [Burkholderiales bacterium]
MHLRASRFGFVLALFLSLAAGSAGAADRTQVFDDAVAAFRAGDYDAALRSFLVARSLGLDTPGLRYNLGVTYFRLQRYAEAQAAFEALSRDPMWSALAHYNLGLVAQRMGDLRQARTHFDLAHRATTDPKLRTLAGVALERVDAATLPPRPGTLVSLGGGYDSNPAVYTENTAAGGGGDYFGELLAVATRNLSGNTALGWNGHGALIWRKYLDQGEFDLQGLRAGISRDTDSANTQFSLGGNYGLVYFDGKLLEQAASLELQARTRLDAGRDLRGRYHLARVDGGGHYRQLDGWQHRASADAGFGWGRALWRAGLQFEIEDRRDLAQGGEFLSYSPKRQLLFATAELPDVAGWQADLRLEYRASRYRDPYRLDGGTRVVERTDDRTSVALRGSRGAGAGRRVFVEFSYYRNASSIDQYDYRRGQLLAGIELDLEKAP